MAAHWITEKSSQLHRAVRQRRFVILPEKHLAAPHFDLRLHGLDDELLLHPDLGVPPLAPDSAVSGKSQNAVAAHRPVPARIRLIDEIALFRIRRHGKLLRLHVVAEEVIKSLKEEKVIYQEENRWKIREISRIEFPKTVKAVIKARIGRLDDECQNVLMMASFIGNDVTCGALCGVTGIEEDKMIMKNLTKENNFFYNI
jgi:hypothetical protein